MKNTEDLEEWLFIAKSNLDSARYLAHMKPFPASVICYHSQQCVGKPLKGFLTLNGRTAPKTHNLLTNFRKEFSFLKRVKGVAQR
ncbi:hypothetical protein IK7_05674 [Bacillus cereus VD156]|nr:hypothetical protein IK7_05674 [Bacillus cereus VD156]